ncbi:MAG: glycosyltransferase, partial [Gemmatimonadales bacterium]|nr:glycosyltransferase [Gemmatimonadales bacterium]
MRIATYNRGAVLCERTIPTVLAQTYPHFELLIVGDHCTDDTEERVKALKDPRIRFVNLPERGNYP